MKTKAQSAQDLHDSLTDQFVLLEVEVRYLRLENKHKEKEQAMLERDNIALRITLLEQYMRETSPS